jgi:hypothetical protein
MSQKAARWADDWIIENAPADLEIFSDSFIAAEVTRFIADAQAEGIVGNELHDTLGNLEAYLLEEYERKLNEERAERHGRGD